MWFVEKKDWTFFLIVRTRVFICICLEGVTEDCRSHLYSNVLSGNTIGSKIFVVVGVFLDENVFMKMRSTVFRNYSDGIN